MRDVITTKDGPAAIGPYSQAIKANGFVFVSGQIALDPKTHRIYLPTAQFEPAPSPSPGASPTRPKIVPNTLKLLVYGPSESPKS